MAQDCDKSLKYLTLETTVYNVFTGFTEMKMCIQDASASFAFKGLLISTL